MADPPAQSADVQIWYHTLELPGRGTTPGWFDLRDQVQRLPWPDAQGRRCLDVGTYDGFYAFELERRGAAEVVATDIPDHREWDWPLSMREAAPSELSAVVGEKGGGFEVAREALDSAVSKRAISVYDLRPEAVGTFDVVVCGSLLLHLRDPVRALEAIRSVCTGSFMSVEAVSLPLSRLFPHRAMAELCEEDERCQWWKVNAAGHRRLLEAAGFEVVRALPVYAEPFGPGHPAAAPGAPALSRRERLASAMRKLTLGRDGVPHAAILARPRRH